MIFLATPRDFFGCFYITLYNRRKPALPAGRRHHDGAGLRPYLPSVFPQKKGKKRTGGLMQWYDGQKEMPMEILDLSQAMERGRTSRGPVFINNKPDLRSGKRDDYMTGEFYLNGRTYPFRIWDKDIYQIILEYGPGIYIAETVGSDFNGPYLTVRSIDLYPGNELSRHDFMGGIPRAQLMENLGEVKAILSRAGVTDSCWELVNLAINHPDLDNRFLIEGAATRHHDNIIGGLANHTTKMLRILGALLENNTELQKAADLLAFSVFMHDIGKIFEYHDLDVAEYWFANHRVRGIEFLAKIKEDILSRYDENFYRQVQSVIAGHHGLYGDRPTTVAAAIVHYIDVLESQTTELVREQMNAPGGKIRHPDFGFLRELPLSDE